VSGRQEVAGNKLSTCVLLLIDVQVIDKVKEEAPKRGKLSWQHIARQQLHSSAAAASLLVRQFGSAGDAASTHLLAEACMGKALTST
jgi:hypothetical protein